jgi:hypothetical membrane protein
MLVSALQDMTNTRVSGFLGIAACVEFWGASFVLGALRPSYSHSVNTISELGARGTPNAAVWNIVGFIVPGLLLALVGGAIAQSIGREKSVLRTLSTALLVLSGLAIAGQGVIPAEMTNGVADITSPYTRGHFISSLVSGAAWVIGVLLLIGPMKRSPEWRRWRIVSVVLVVLTLSASIVLRGALPDGLAQRLGNGVFFTWFVLTSLKLMRLGGDRSAVVHEGAGAA